jgi:hypothetical protein
MNTAPASSQLLYPTPSLEQLFPRLSTDLDRVRRMLGPLAFEVSADPDVYTHARMLTFADSLLQSSNPALALFLYYPTKRLAQVLVKSAADATAAVAWLAQHPPEISDPAARQDEYQACCERIQSGIADWRLSVDLKWAMHDFDYCQPETLH